MYLTFLSESYRICKADSHVFPYGEHAFSSAAPWLWNSCNLLNLKNCNAILNIMKKSKDLFVFI